MKTHMLHLFLSLALTTSAVLVLAQPPDSTPSDQSSDEPGVQLVIGDQIGAQPRLAVPRCLALSDDAETHEAAQTFAEVLWDDLNFEREFLMVARDTYDSVPAARSVTNLPLQPWRELGADGVVICAIERTGEGQIRVTVRLFNLQSPDSPFGAEYMGAQTSLRTYAHQLSDDVHRAQRGLKGVARSKIAFISDRDSESMLGLVENRATKEVYFADYDGANVRRVTISRTLNNNPAWSPDGRSIAYTAWRPYMDVFVSHIYQGRLESPAGGSLDVQNWLPAWSPDGSQLAFTSSRDGNSEVYIIDADGKNLQRLTNHPDIDTSPTWSPQGHQLAFVSDRPGSLQVYVIGVDGTGLRRITFESHCDRPTWSPAPYNEIAYSSQPVLVTTSRSLTSRRTRFVN